MLREVIAKTVTVADGAVPLVIELGFKPSYVRIINLTQVQTMEWFSDMTANHWFKTVTAGTFTAETTNGPSIVETNTAGSTNDYAGDIVPVPNLVSAGGSLGISIPAANLTTGDVLFFLAVRH